MSYKEPKKTKADDILNNFRKGKCPECGGELIQREGKYGKFWGCENFPKCDFSINDNAVERLKQHVRRKS